MDSPSSLSLITSPGSSKCLFKGAFINLSDIKLTARGPFLKACPVNHSLSCICCHESYMTTPADCACMWGTVYCKVQLLDPVLPARLAGHCASPACKSEHCASPACKPSQSLITKLDNQVPVSCPHLCFSA